ncbi:MAG: MtrAB system response regulator MtrA [Propioniciclava sp.]
MLVVDDDAALAEMLQMVLQAAGFEAHWVAHGDLVLREFRRLQPGLVLLDVMLPGRDGVDVCRDLRAESDVPIVMLTARSDTVDVVNGLEAGADDYVVKPFKTQELLARVKTRLRRSATTENEPVILTIGDVAIDVEAHTVHRGDEAIGLTPLEFDLLLALARKPRQAFTRELLLQEVWGYRHPGDTRLVNVHVQRLRSKIERDPEHPEVILTVRGVGYRAGSTTP